METPSFKFTMPMRVDVVEEKGEQKIFLEGFLSTSDMDLVNDVVTKNCLESMKRQILDRNIKLDIEHEAFRGNSVEEKEINKTKIPAGRFIDAAVESIGNNRWGLRVKSMLNRFRPDFAIVKGNVVDRMLDAYSIAFIATKVRHETINGKSVRFLDDVALLNAALTGNPINTEALNREIFTKSIDSIEDYEKEKKANPDTARLLEVKGLQSSSQEHDESIDSIKAGGNKMQNDQPTQLDEKDGGVHGGTYGSGGGNAPGKESSKIDETTSSSTTTATQMKDILSEVQVLKARVDVLEAENKQLKSVSVPKSPGANMGTVKQMEAEKKSVEGKIGPLDLL